MNAPEEAELQPPFTAAKIDKQRRCSVGTRFIFKRLRDTDRVLPVCRCAFLAGHFRRRMASASRSLPPRRTYGEKERAPARQYRYIV